MTNEQAITKLQQYLDSNLIEDLTGNEGVDEAIRMGADALRQPEIVRCKDCKYSSPNKVYGCRFERFDTWEDGPRMYSDDFCSRAERREE